MTNRRDLLKLSAAGLAVAQSGCISSSTRSESDPLKVAAVVTEYRWFSHADVVCGRLLGGYSANNQWQPPRTKLVSLYRAQVPKNDMAADLSARHGFRLYSSIQDALTLGGPKLAVDAVVFIGEHGDYPTNDVGQKLYPRYELFSQILDVYEQNKKGVPTLFDKHFSYDWKKAKELFERSRKLGFPLIAGSSVPLTLRSPDIQPDLDTPMTEAVAVGYGPIDAYGFHLLEILQCIVERRKGGETGVKEVEMIEGDRIWSWMEGEGNWSKQLVEAAFASGPSSQQGSYRSQAKDPVLIRIKYTDGFKGAVLILSPAQVDWTFAARVSGQAEPIHTLFWPHTDRPLPHFDGFVRCAEEMFVTGKELYPPERTLLTTCVLSQAFESKRANSPVKTPELNITYKAPADVYYQTA